MWIFLTNDDAGFEDGWTWIMERVTEEMRVSLLREANRILKNAHDVEDVWQNTIMIAAQNYRQIREQDKLYAWMFKVIHNEALRYRSTLPGKGVWYDIRLAISLADPRMNVEYAAFTHIQTERMKEEIDKLGPPDDEIIRMRYFEGRPYSEIAEKLNMNESTVRSRVNRSLKRLSRILGDER